MKSSRFLIAVAVLCVAGGLIMAAGVDLTPVEQLGKSIYFDHNLSINQNQACATCHAPESGWTGPFDDINQFGSVYEGSIPGRFGARKPPSAAYATTAPIFHYAVDEKEPLFVGGNFWDGRATGEKLGNPAADQAQGPFLAPPEQAFTDYACVVYRVCNPVVMADYPVLLDEVYPGSCDIAWPMDADVVCATDGGVMGLTPEDRETASGAYDSIALAIAAYEGSPEVNAYSSKYDYVMAGLAEFTKEEKRGFSLYKGKGKCAACHTLEGEEGEPALFTDYTFDNLGIPKNVYNPVYDVNPDFVDHGLGGYLATLPELWADLAEENMGKHKVPTLRNITKGPYPGFTKAYMHNGYFKTLEGVVHFYNTRDEKRQCEDPWATEAEALAMKCWPAPEVAENVNTTELGNLHMSPKQEEWLVEFLKTLDDGWVPPAE